MLDSYPQYGTLGGNKPTGEKIMNFENCLFVVKNGSSFLTFCEDGMEWTGDVAEATYYGQIGAMVQLNHIKNEFPDAEIFMYDCSQPENPNVPIAELLRRFPHERYRLMVIDADGNESEYTGGDFIGIGA